MTTPTFHTFSIEQLQNQLTELSDTLDDLQSREITLKQELAKRKSLKFIYDNAITKAAVQCCDADEVPFFNNIRHFSNWLVKTGNEKPWCSWNGFLYRTSEVKKGKMDVNAVGRYKDLV